MVVDHHSHSGPPKGILQGRTRLLWGTGDKLRLLSKFRIWGVFGLTWSGLEPTTYRNQGEHANNYTTDAEINGWNVAYVHGKHYMITRSYNEGM
jgi:hypothetical protein